MITWDEGRIDLPHRIRIQYLSSHASLPPRGSPRIIGGAIREQGSCASIAGLSFDRVAQMAERQREVGSIVEHPLQQILRQRIVPLLPMRQTDLAAQAAKVGWLKAASKALQNFLRDLYRLILVIG